jgi:hypothetical protein
MRTFKCRIVGTTDLIMRRFSAELAEKTDSKKLSPEEEAELAVYRDPHHGSHIYVPGIWLQNLVRSTGKKYYKDYRNGVPAAVQIIDENIFLFDPETERPIHTYAIDARSAVVPRTGERIMRYRPRMDHWAAEFYLNINDRILPVAQIKKLMVEGGEEIGLGELRPQVGGPFGIFAVADWEEM